MEVMRFLWPFHSICLVLTCGLSVGGSTLFAKAVAAQAVEVDEGTFTIENSCIPNENIVFQSAFHAGKFQYSTGLR